MESSHTVRRGHELRHAVEIASTPSVVDGASMAQCYHRIGFNVSPYLERFDTEDAVECGRRVLREAMTNAKAATSTKGINGT